MRARFLRSWWQQIKQHRVALGVVAMVLVVAITLIIVGYWFDWAGFNGYNKITVAHTISGTNAGTVIRTEEYQPGRTLWDWLQLLIIPLVLAIAALLFNLATTRTEQKIAAQRYEQDRHIALDKQREDLLQTYLDRMSELLLKEKLRSSAVDAEVRNVARVRTATILFQLDARRIGYVFAFLRESGLMSTKPNDSIVSLSQTNLSKINLSQAFLYNADLSGAILYKADLSYADLSKADLSYANLRGAILREADLGGADLYLADLSHANLGGANLEGANLAEAYLAKADLREADLRGADLYKATLSGADLSKANLHGAILSNALLSGAIVTPEQLDKALSLKDTILPDGSIHP